MIKAALVRLLEVFPQRLAKPLPSPSAVVAVSGGADSVTLLLAAAEAAPALGWRISALHCNHGLRGRASDADLEFVRELCAGLGVGLRVFSTKLKKGAGIEERARDWRRRCYAAAAKKAGAKLILLGQHRGDQVETVLMNLARGAGWKGAGGMQALAELPKTGGVWLGRPFLELEPGALRSFLKARGERWREDASNADLGLARNRVRRKVLPELRKAYPGADASITAFACRAAGSEQVLALLLAKELARLSADGGIDLKALASFSEVCRRELLRAWVRDQGGTVSETGLQRMDSLALGGKGAVSLGAGILAQASVGILRCVNRSRGKVLKAKALGVGLAIKFGAWTLRLERVEVALRKVLQAASGNESAYYFSPAAGPRFTVRAARAGDRFRPFGLKGSKLVMDCLAEGGIPAWERANYPLLVGDGAQVLAIPGLRRGSDFPLNSRAIGALKFSWMRAL